METQFTSFVFGVISTLFISFVSHFLSIKRFRQATIYGEQVKCYSEIMPILFSPIDQEMSTAELKLIFNKAILVSNASLSKELLIFYNYIIDVRLGKGLHLNRKNNNLFYNFIKKCRSEKAKLRTKFLIYREFIERFFVKKFHKLFAKFLIKQVRQKKLFGKLYIKFFHKSIKEIRNRPRKLHHYKTNPVHIYDFYDIEIISKVLTSKGKKIIKMIHKEMNL